MAVAFDAKSNSSGAAVSGLTWTHTPSGTPTGVAVIITGYGVAGAGATCTYGGTSMTQNEAIVNTDGAIVFSLANPASGAQSVVFTNAASASCYPIGVAVTVTGGDTSTVISNSAKTSGSGTSASLTVTSATGELVFTGGSQDGQTGAVSAYNGTSVHEEQVGGERGFFQRHAGSSSVASTYTLPGTNAWQLVGVSFKASAGGSGVSADLGVTLGNVTVSGASSAAVNGALASTLANETLSGAASAGINGALTVTLGNETLNGASSASVNAALSATLANATLSGSGTTIGGFVATLSATLANLTLSGDSSAALNAACNAALSAVTLTGSASLPINASMAATLANIVLTASAHVSTGAVLTADDLAAIEAIVDARCSVMLKTWINKMITDPVAGTWTIYADDDVTPLYSGPLYEDAAGTQPYRGRGAEHRGKNTI